MNRNGQGRGMGHGRNGNGNGQERGRFQGGEASTGQGRRGRGFGRGRGMGWQADPENGVRYNRPLNDLTAGMESGEKKSWLENFKTHLMRRMGEVNEELGKF